MDNNTPAASSTSFPTAAATTTNELPASGSQPPQRQQQPRRYIYNDTDLHCFLQSPSKHALYQFTAAIGKACCSNSNSNSTSAKNTNTGTYQYDPEQPLRGLSPGIACLHGALSVLNEWVTTDFSPDTSNTTTTTTAAVHRFGNPVFRQWHTQLQTRSTAIIGTMLHISQLYSKPQTTTSVEEGDDEYDLDILRQAHNAGIEAACNTTTSTSTTSTALDNLSVTDRIVVQELSLYLHDAFGHAIRLDYGTGHETSFHIFLFLLCQCQLFHNTGYRVLDTNTIADNAASEAQRQQQLPPIQRCRAIILSIYHQYLHVTRTIQTVYNLEPAGSHGVWGLDDYHCLPFYFGACQLVSSQQSTNDDILPSSIHDAAMIQERGDTYLYLGCIRFIQSIKKNVPFYESSPMLNDISHIATWMKIAQGLLKLYDGEVLSKRQVVQHLLFGTLFPANWIPSQIEEDHTRIPTETFRTTTATATINTATTSTTNIPTVTRAPWAK
jgi:Phosphotyrosyl phosphate activator (PTPA) protein